MINSSFWQSLWRIELAAIISLVFYAVLVAIIFAVENLISEDPILSLPGAIFIGGGYTLFIGLPAVVFYGAPVYSVHLKYRSFRFIWVIVLALIPGGILFVFDQAMGVFAVAGGCSVALCTRYISIRWFDIELNPAAFSTDYDNPKSDTGRDSIAVE